MLRSIKTELLATCDAFLVSSQDCSAHGGDLRSMETFLEGRVLSVLGYFVAFLSTSNTSAKEICVSVDLALCVLLSDRLP